MSTKVKIIIAIALIAIITGVSIYFYNKSKKPKTVAPVIKPAANPLIKTAAPLVKEVSKVEDAVIVSE